MAGLMQALILISSAAALSYSLHPPHVFNVLDYHAVGDGLTDDSKAFVDTWNTACHIKNAIMLVPPMRNFLLNPLSFRGPCELGFAFQIDGTILAPEDPKVWEDYGGLKHWIEIGHVSEFTMYGSGAIDGQGYMWWYSSCKKNPNNPCRKAPTSIIFRECTNVKLQMLTFQNSQQFVLSFVHSKNIIAQGLCIRNPHDSPNTDGIHIEYSQSILIQDTIIETGDDCISIATGSSDILIQNVRCGPGHGISIGSLGKMGSFGQVSNVTVQTVVLKDTSNGLRIKTWQGGKGYVKSIRYQDIQMINVSNPLIIDEFYCDSHNSFTCGLHDRSVAVSDVVYFNIIGTSSTKVAMRFQCSEQTPCTSIFVEHIHLTLLGGDNASSFCKNVFGHTGEDVTFSSCLVS